MKIVTKPKNKLQALTDLIESAKINKKYLAELAGINAYTFKMKLSGKNPAYKFTDTEFEMINSCLCELATKLQEHCSQEGK